MNNQPDYDVFHDDFFNESPPHSYPTLGHWGLTLLHLIKGSFVFYSGAHNIQASLTATGGSLFAAIAQIIGVLVLEVTITALYMAGIAGKITGRLQALIASSFWIIGMALASAGIVADSRLHAGQELGDLLNWYLHTGLYLAPVIMVIGSVLVIFTDPLLSQQIANARDRSTIERQKVRSAVLAEKAAHEARKIVHNIRLGAQRQMAVEARKYYESPEVQTVLRQTAIEALQDVMRQAGIQVSAPTTSTQPPLPANSDIPLVQLFPDPPATQQGDPSTPTPATNNQPSQDNLNHNSNPTTPTSQQHQPTQSADFSPLGGDAPASTITNTSHQPEGGREGKKL
ncbi:MAG TPA: hypothetical protein VLL52_13580 [Anaerolineae bacterium]|nr:hypothetical protein [Anaerolineae bacterium]